jgi:hypothetical protein
MCAPLEGGSGPSRGLTKLLEVVQHIWMCEKVEESWLVGKLRLLPKSGDLSNSNNWRGITLLAVIAKLFCSVLSNRMTSHMQVIGLEAQCGFMPGKSTMTPSSPCGFPCRSVTGFRRIRGCFLSILSKLLTPCLGRCSSRCLLASDSLRRSQILYGCFTRT